MAPGVRFAGLLAVLVTASLHSQTAQSGRSWGIADVPTELRPLVAQADLIVVEIQGALLRELSGALARGSPATALQSCHVDAIAVTQRMTRRRDGVDAGRTSHRLRNPANAPKPWTVPFVDAHAGRKARDVDGFVVDLGDRIGVMRPIALQPVCGSCHGPEAGLTPSVRQAIAARYPGDAATGFETGDIRGWYWVELPAPAR